MDFKKGTLYVFQAKLIEDKDAKDIKEADILWRNKCNNKVVKVSEDGYIGTIEVEGVIYKVLRKWTRVVPPEKVEAFLKATGQINPNI